MKLKDVVMKRLGEKYYKDGEVKMPNALAFSEDRFDFLVEELENRLDSLEKRIQGWEDFWPEWQKFIDRQQLGRK